MFRAIKQLPSMLERIAVTLEGLIEAVHGLYELGSTDTSLVARMDDMERRVGLVVADAEAKLLQAEGKLKAARAAEERERRLAESAARRSDSDDDEFTEDEIAEAYARAGVHLPNGQPGGDQGVLPLPSGVDARREGKARAIAAKWGR